MNKKRTIYVLISTLQGMKELFNFSQKFRLRKRHNRFNYVIKIIKKQLKNNLAIPICVKTRNSTF